MNNFETYIFLLIVACMGLRHEGWSKLLSRTSRLSLVSTKGQTVFTTSYMRSADAHYYIAGHTVGNNTSSRVDTHLIGRPFIEKHLLSKDHYVWRYAIDANNTRISSMASNARGTTMFVAGHSHEMARGSFVQRLFLAEINTGRRRPKLGNVVRGGPMAFLRVNKIVVESNYVYLCGRSVGLGNSSVSGSYALMYNSSLSLKWRSQSKGGSSRTFCSDILLSSDDGRAYKLITKFDLESDKERTYGHVQAFEPPTGKELWSATLKPEYVMQLSLLPKIPKHDAQQAINGSTGTEHNLSLEKFLAFDSALFVSARISSMRDKSNAYNVMLKMSTETGLILWAQAILPPPAYNLSFGYLRPAGTVYAADDYIYTLARYRDIFYMYLSVAARVSIFQDFTESKDVSLPLWRSNSSECAPVGVVYSSLRGAILAFGKSSLISDSTVANATYVELPIGPAKNGGARLPCLGCNGAEFVRICFDLVIANTTLLRLKSAKEMIRESLRLFSFQTTPGELRAKKSAEEEAAEYCVLLRGEDPARLEQELRSRIQKNVFKLGADGRNIIERRFNVPPNTIYFRHNTLTVKSKGSITKKTVTSKRRSLKDVADDFMRALTLAGIFAGAFGTAAVLLAVILGKLQEELKKKRNRSGSADGEELESFPKNS